jgi:hypothetical protein
VETVNIDQAKTNLALLNQSMNANCASHLKVSLDLGFKNPTKEDSYLKSATPKIPETAAIFGHKINQFVLQTNCITLEIAL